MWLHHSDGESCFKYPPSTPAGWQLPKQDDIWGEMGALLPFYPISGVPSSPDLILQRGPAARVFHPILHLRVTPSSRQGLAWKKHLSFSPSNELL